MNGTRLCFWFGLVCGLTSHAAAQVPNDTRARPTVTGASAYTSNSGQPTHSALPPPSAASEPPSTDDWGQRRVLAGHRFPQSVFLPTALLSSSLGVRAGIEYHAVPGYAQLPSLISASAPQLVDLQTVNVDESLDFELRLHDYFALFGDAYGAARVGANISTLLGTGADYTYGGDAGLMAKLVRVQGFQLSIRAQLGYYIGQSAGILALFQDLNNIASGAISQVVSNPTLDINNAINQLNVAFSNATADLLTPFHGIRYGTSLNAAQALGRYVGLQASIGFGSETATYYPTRYDVSTAGPLTTQYSLRTLRPSFGIALDVDAGPVGLPVDLLLEYQVTPITLQQRTRDVTNSEYSIENLVAVGVYYSGRTDLQLGATGYSLVGQTPALGANARPSGKPRDLGVQLVFRYFW
jgi:hypothetical protein